MQKTLFQISFICVLLFNTLLFGQTYDTLIEPPELTVVIIIDQFAYHYLPKLKKHFRYGLKKLFTEGRCYEQAYHAQAIPETTPGHHAISTGTLPKDHGGILNQWINNEYKRECYDTDPDPKAAVFQPPYAQETHHSEHTNSKTPLGKSCIKTMIDGLSDQFILTKTPGYKRKVFALSLKSHPAIALANRLGKPIWFDDVSGGFTSSKKYFSRLPEWVTNLNKTHKFSTLSNVYWRTMRREQDVAYNFADSKNYDYAGYDFSLISKPSIAIDRTTEKPFELYLKTPTASNALIDLAKECISQNFTSGSDRMLLWLSISTLDLVGHIYGPDSMEAIDTLYHIDKQIQELMTFISKKVDAKNCLYVLTGDHGIAPIPELMHKRGVLNARRIMSKTLIDDLNKLIKQKYDLGPIIKDFEPTYFILDKTLLGKQEPDKQKAILSDLKQFLQSQPGIKSVWTSHELEQATFLPDQPENHYKTQLYRGRSGDLICMPQPYCLITNYPKGTSHLSPYEYDTHVPLVLYQQSRIQPNVISEKVWIPQLPVTLAHMLHIPPPSASTYQILPGINS